MASGFDRRAFLTAAACSAVAARGVALPRISDVAGETEVEEAALEEIVRWLLATPREHVLERAARALESGVDTRTLLAAVFVGAVREISPRVPRFNHAALVVSSIDQLTIASSTRERVGLALWSIDSLKDSQEIDAKSGDWKLGKVDGARLPARNRARDELVRALEAWDLEAADVALAGFVRSAPLEDVLELVSEYGTRCQANIGHKAIYVAMARRMLPLVGPKLFEDVLRSVVASYFLHGKSDRAAPFEASRALVAGGLARKSDAAVDPNAARGIYEALRKAKPLDAPELVADRLRDGCPDAAAWDAITTCASEIVVADPAIGPLHALTSANALHHLYRTAASARVRDLALLQAAAWTCLFRDGVLTARSLPAIPGIERDETTTPRAKELVTGALARVRDAADDVHEIKVAAAALEEIGCAGDFARPALLHALEVHLPPRDRPESDVLHRVRAATRTAIGD